MFRNTVGCRFVVFTAFVVASAAAHAQINVSGNPNAYYYQYKENFEEFTAGSYPAPTNVGLLDGVSIFGGNAAISLGTPSDGTQLYVYTPYSVNVNTDFGLSSAGYAGVYDGTQGLGAMNYTNPDPTDAYLTTETITMQASTNGYTFFGGYFQSAVFGSSLNLNPTQINFSFYNGSNLVESFSENPNPTPTVNDSNVALTGYAFTFNSGYSFTSVVISGDFVAMDSLRVNSVVEGVPEPAPMAVMALGLGALALLRRRR